MYIRKREPEKTVSALAMKLIILSSPTLKLRIVSLVTLKLMVLSSWTLKLTILSAPKNETQASRE